MHIRSSSTDPLSPHTNGYKRFGAVLSMLGMAVNGLAGAFSDRK